MIRAKVQQCWQGLGLAIALSLGLVGCAPNPAVKPAIPEAGGISPGRIPAADPLAPVRPLVRPPVRIPRPALPQPTRPVPPQSAYVPPPPVIIPPSTDGLPVATGANYLAYPAMQAFLAQMQREHGFDRAWLEQLFAGVQRENEVLAKVQTPAEGKPWHQYRPIFLTEDRIGSGVAFWQRHAPVLDAAARHYGVDPAYIVAIIGVETLYGRNTGKHNVLRSLTTLAFDFPKRADFYRKELEQYLLLVREERLNPAALSGSYAGAMGLGQFISSSYRQYAQDFNHDQRRDLWHPDDAIGSVANYLARHGWQAGEDVAAPAYVSGQGYARLLNDKPVKPTLGLTELGVAGVVPAMPLRVRQAGLVGLEGQGGQEFWVVGSNFYVITRYNHSSKYAMAVHQLADAIRQRMGR